MISIKIQKKSEKIKVGDIVKYDRFGEIRFCVVTEIVGYRIYGYWQSLENTPKSFENFVANNRNTISLIDKEKDIDFINILKKRRYL